MSKTTGFIVFLFFGGLIVFIATQVFSGTLKTTENFSIFNIKSPLKPPVVVKNPTVGKLPTVGPNGNVSQTSSVSIPSVQPPSGWKSNQLSPYYGQVKISSIKTARSFPSESGFKLSASYSSKNQITVTGWHVKSNKGDIVIPEGIGDYIPFGIPARGPITLPANGSVTVSSRESPIKENLRMNSCIGYLNERYSFSPTLPSQCPKPYSDRSEIASFPGDCQSFILSLAACHAPTTAELSRFPGYPYEACHTLLEKFTYASCYTRERSKSNFFSGEWRVWMNSFIPFDVDHDRILVLDEKGLLVDQYIY